MENVGLPKFIRPRPYWIQYVSTYIVFFLSLFVCKIKVNGKNNIPKDKPFVLASNHFGYFDPFVLVHAIRKLIDFIMQDRQPQNIPDGCLFVLMKAQRHCFGPTTRKCLDGVRTHFVSSFATWIDASKSAGAFRKDIPTNAAVHQIEALHAGASSLQGGGESPEEVKQMLTFGLAAISGENAILI